MYPRTLREFGLCALSVGLFSLFLALGTGSVPTAYHTAVIAGLCFAGLIMLAWSWGREPVTHTPVDIWAMQRALMVKSGQALPDRPEMNSSVLLYYALTLEEAAEAAATIGRIISHADGRGWAYANMLDTMNQTSQMLQTQSSRIKRHAATTRLSMPLKYEDAKALFDDTTDMTVTIAGLPLAAGLPAAAGYTEVQRSNLSKAHPITGRIEKTSDGKWIKGTAYTEPNLGAVLQHAWRAAEATSPQGQREAA